MTTIQATARSPFFVWTGLAVLTALMFVWPLQHTIALRYLLLGLGLIWSVTGWLAYGRERESGRLSLAVFSMLALLTVWMYVGAFTWAMFPDKTLHEIAGQWLITLTSFCIGVSAAYLLPAQRRLLVRLLFAVLAVNVWALVGLDVGHWVIHGDLIRRYGGLEAGHWFKYGDSMDKANYLTNMYFAFLLAELVLRRAGRVGVIGFGYVAIAVFFATGLFATYLEDLRNGMGALTLMILLTAVLAILISPPERRKREFAVMALVMLVGGLFVGYVVSHQERWRTLIATVPIALDTQHNREWMVMDKVPTFPDGRPVDGSNYQRIAWAKVASMMLWSHPLGMGFQRDAFGDGVDVVYHTDLSHGMHSHSGILDFADGVGFPGLAMWVIFVLGIWVSALSAFRRYLIAPAAIVLIVVFDYCARSVVDSILRDHMWQMFMFLIGFLATWTAIERNRSESGQ